MPKVSKVKVSSSRPGDSSTSRASVNKFTCTRCGATYKKQQRNFCASQSALFGNNGGYLPVCNNCVDDLFTHYRTSLGNEEDAIRRICLKFDLYWHPRIYEMVMQSQATTNRIRTYISKTNLNAYIGKTYDDTIDEEAKASGNFNTSEDSQEVTEMPPCDVIEFWGVGYTAQQYRDLERKFAKWHPNATDDVDNATLALYRQVCLLESAIDRNIIAGKPIEPTVNTLNTILGSLNEKPVQKRQEDTRDDSFDNLPLGIGIRMYENTRPIPKPDPKFDDVDGIVKYISIWFLGHLCKMLKLKNTYSKLYDDEIARMRVERPELEEEDDEGVFNAIFGDGDP